MSTHDYAMTWEVLDDSLPMPQLQRIAEPEFYRALQFENLTQVGNIRWVTDEIAGVIFIGARVPVLTYEEGRNYGT